MTSEDDKISFDDILDDEAAHKAVLAPILKEPQPTEHDIEPFIIPPLPSAPSTKQITHGPEAPIMHDALEIIPPADTLKEASHSHDEKLQQFLKTLNFEDTESQIKLGLRTNPSIYDQIEVFEALNPEVDYLPI